MTAPGPTSPARVSYGHANGAEVVRSRTPRYIEIWSVEMIAAIFTIVAPTVTDILPPYRPSHGTASDLRAPDSAISADPGDHRATRHTDRPAFNRTRRALSAPAEEYRRRRAAERNCGQWIRLARPRDIWSRCHGKAPEIVPDQTRQVTPKATCPATR